MIIGTLENGTTCVYDLPDEIKTAEQFQKIQFPADCPNGKKDKAAACPTVSGKCEIYSFLF